MKAHRLTFTGSVLERGFWLYVWHVTCGAKTLLYVGRTGDSSSRFAASPFNRLGQHLDVRKKATANMLFRHLCKHDIDPLSAHFELFAIGPIFPEQTTLEAHRKYRDVVAPLEAALANHLANRGFPVVGMHSSKHDLDRKLFAKILKASRKLLASLPANKSNAASSRDPTAANLVSQ